MTGYRQLPTSDPREAELRQKWHAAKASYEKGEVGGQRSFEVANDILSSYLWRRTCGEIEADRKKHPKKKRNQVYQGPIGEGRNLP